MAQQKYKYQLTNGKQLTLEGDTQPSDEEVESIAREQNVQLQPANEEIELPSISPTEIQLKPGFGNARPDFKSVEGESSTDSPIPERGIVGQGWDAIKSGWDALSSPMIPKPQSLKTVEDAYAEDNPISGNIGRFGTDMLYGSTSPLNVGLAATTGGTGIAAKAGLPKIAQALRYGTKALSAPVAAEGAYHMATGETWPERVLGGVELAGGILGLKSKLPAIGKSISHTIETPSGRTTVTAPENVISDLRSRMDKTITPEVMPMGEGVGDILSDGTVMNPEANRWNSQAIARKEADKVVADKLSLRKARGEQLTPEEEMTLGFEERFNNRDTIDTSLVPEGVDPNTGEVLNSQQPVKAPTKESILKDADYITSTDGMSKEQARFNKFLTAANNFPEEVFTELASLAKEYRRFGPGTKEAANVAKQMIKIRDFMEGGLSPRNTPTTIGSGFADVLGFDTPGGNRQTATLGNQPPNKPPIKSSIISQGEDPTPEMNRLNTIGKFANESQKKSLWGEARDANRALLTAYDFSAPGRQGKPLLLTKAYWTSLDDMVKAWGSQRAYDNILESIESHPNFQHNIVKGKEMPSLADRAGLKWHGNEEVFQSNIADKFIPGVHRSNRAYNAFLGKLRADHFNTLVDDYVKSGVNIKGDDTKLKGLADFINNATGRGSLGSLERAAPILNEMFFAPKLMASRVNMYRRFLNPKTYSNEDPILRKQALKSLIAIAGFGTAVGELSRLAGAEVSNDPNSSDFRKIKIGNTRIDPFSGFQQYAVGASRLLSGSMTSSKSGKEFDLTSGKFGMPSRASIVSQFAQNKLAPIPSLVWSWMEGKDWDGQPFEIKKAILDRTVPIVMQDLYELQKEDPKLLPLGILPIIGEGLQTYGR